MGMGPLNRIELMALPVDLRPRNEAPTAARDLIKAVKELNRTEFAASERQLTFLWDSASSQPVIRVVDRKTGEVIEEIPPEQFRQMMNDLTKPKK